MTFTAQLAASRQSTEDLSHESDLVAAADRRREFVLAAMAKVQIQIGSGLRLIVPGVADRLLEDDFAKDFTELPKAFARAYLQLQLRDFLYETFCLSDRDAQDDPAVDSQSEVFRPIANDRLNGGLHIGLLNHFRACNSGTGYFDPGWVVVGEVSETAGEALAVIKQGVVVEIERSRHLKPDQQTAQVDDMISVRLPAYRFEPDYYIAIGNLGPVLAVETAIEIYIAANVSAMAPILSLVTQTLNATETAIPFTLRLPYRPESYQAIEAIALRVEATAYEVVRAMLEEIAQQCPAQSADHLSVSRALHSSALLDQLPTLRSVLPVFAYPLFPGISVAAVLENKATEWFGSQADLSRCDVFSEALVTTWEAGLEIGEMPGVAQNLQAMRSHLEAQDFCWQAPYHRLSQSIVSAWFG